MHIAVCVKQIPDPSVPPTVDASFHLERTAKILLDEADTYGVELALQLVEAAGEGQVTLVSMGAADDVSGIRGALAMGATRAVIVSDSRLRGAYALTTAKVLAAVIAPLEADLVVAATESSDGYTGTVPAQIAELLGLPALTFATTVAVEGSAVTIRRQREDGFDEVRCALPALVTVTAGAVEPRYANFKGIMAAKSKTIDVRSLDDLGLATLGNAWGEEVVSVTPSPSRQGGTTIVDDGHAVAALVDYLDALKVL